MMDEALKGPGCLTGGAWKGWGWDGKLDMYFYEGAGRQASKRLLS